MVSTFATQTVEIPSIEDETPQSIEAMLIGACNVLDRQKKKALYNLEQYFNMRREEIEKEVAADVGKVHVHYDRKLHAETLTIKNTLHRAISLADQKMSSDLARLSQWEQAQLASWNHHQRKMRAEGKNDLVQ
jgi:hypothetical protein